MNLRAKIQPSFKTPPNRCSRALSDYLVEKLSEGSRSNVVHGSNKIYVTLEIPAKFWTYVIQPQLDLFSKEWGIPVKYHFELGISKGTKVEVSYLLSRSMIIGGDDV